MEIGCFACDSGARCMSEASTEVEVLSGSCNSLNKVSRGRCVSWDSGNSLPNAIRVLWRPWKVKKSLTMAKAVASGTG